MITQEAPSDAEPSDGAVADGSTDDVTGDETTSPDDTAPPNDTAPADDVATTDGAKSDGTTQDSAATDTKVTDTGGSCGAPTLAVRRPVDVFVAVDQTPSMLDELPKVNAGLGALGTALDGLGIDWRVVLMAETTPNGAEYKVCPAAPVGGPSCTASTRLRLVDQALGSTDALSLILSTYDVVPPSPRAWQDFLRADAMKAIVVVTDDTAALAADSFDTQLLAKAGSPFGTAAERRYVAEPLCGASAFPNETRCGATAVNNGAAYLSLAKLTSGKWYSICETNYTPLFASIAKDTVAAAACDLALPAAGGPIDPAKVNVQITPSASSTRPLLQVSACTSDGWMFDTSQTRVRLCGAACTTARSDLTTKVEVTFGCATTKG